MKSTGNTFADVLYEVIAMKGVDVLLNARLLANCMRDIAGSSWTTEHKIAERNLDQDMLKSFHEAAHKGNDEVQAAVRSVTERLRYDCGLSDAIAESIARSMGSAISEYQRDEKRYEEGNRLMDSADYAGALEIFATLGTHRDAEGKARECAVRVDRDLAYEKAKSDYAEAVEEEQYLKLAETFEGFEGYKASGEWSRQCLVQAEKARDAERIYRAAKEVLLDDGLSSEGYREGVRLFKLVDWYKDSAQGVEACEQLASEAARYEAAVATIDGDSSAADLCDAIAAFQLLGAYRNAQEYAAVALERLEASLNNEEAQMNRVQSLEDLEQILKKLEGLIFYRNVNELVEKYRSRIETLEHERDYDRAKRELDEASTSAEFDEAARLFRLLGDFRKAAVHATEARKRAQEMEKEEAYHQAVEAMKRAGNAAEYEKVAQCFDRLGFYKDSQLKAKKCKIESAALKQRAKRDEAARRYRSALGQMESASNEAEYLEAAKSLRELHGFENAAALAKTCVERADECRKSADYSAILEEKRLLEMSEDLEDSDKEESYLNLAKRLQDLGSFKDSRQLASQCLTEAEICRKDSVLSAAKQILELGKGCADKHDKVSHFKYAKEQFDIIAEWKDARQYSEVCWRLIRKYELQWARRALVCAAMVATIAACIAVGWNSTHFEVDGIHYSNGLFAKGDIATVEGYSGASPDVTIPNHVNGFSVKRIASGAFRGNSTVKRVIVKARIDSVPDEMFLECRALTTVRLPASVTSINDRAFSNCSALSEVTMPENLQNIGQEAFFHCTALTSLELPDSVATIGEAAFAYSGFKGCRIPLNTREVPSRAFANCKSLESVEMHEKISEIGADAFSGCEALGGIDVPYSALAGCTKNLLASLENVSFVGYGKDNIEEALLNEPVYVSSAVKKDSFEFKKYGSNPALQLALANQSDKRVTEVSVVIYAWDSDGNQTEIYSLKDGGESSGSRMAERATYAHLIEPGGIWDDAEEKWGCALSSQCASQIASVKCVVAKVTYEDGTVWANPWATVFECLYDD